MSEFADMYQGLLHGIREWSRWERFRGELAARADAGWYVYFIGQDCPRTPVDAPTFRKVLDEVDALLRRDHQERYLGIVYVNDFDHPRLIKIYDPNNLGASCGHSGKVVLPGWVFSRMPPEPLGTAIVPEGRKRWWREILHG